MIDVGTKVENFTLQNDAGEEVTLESFGSVKKVIYFYPKDNTPGCTKEACSLRDDHAEITQKGAIVIGISADSVKSHGNFKTKFGLPFTLLSDPDKKVIQQFGAWGEKSMYGKTYEGIMRYTFILDEQNVVTKVFKKVKTAEHGKEILAVL